MEMIDFLLDGVRTTLDTGPALAEQQGVDRLERAGRKRKKHWKKLKRKKC